jgi:hypothetical protein
VHFFPVTVKCDLGFSKPLCAYLLIASQTIFVLRSCKIQNCFFCTIQGSNILLIEPDGKCKKTSQTLLRSFESEADLIGL